jgi:hypothetical protein
VRAHGGSQRIGILSLPETFAWMKEHPHVDLAPPRSSHQQETEENS